MPSSAELISDIDRRIGAAYTYLRVARSLLRNSPSAESATAWANGEDQLNELLERRFTLTCQLETPIDLRPGDVEEVTPTRTEAV